MKRRLLQITLIVLMALAATDCFPQQPGIRFFAAVDGLAPALKIGIKKDFTERYTLQGSAGFYMPGPSLMSWNLFGSYRLTDPKKPLGLHLNLGLLDNYIEVTSPMFSLGLGGGAGLSWRLRNNSALTFRLGVVTGPAIDTGETRWLTLPNYGIEYDFPVRNRK
ncbi:MAG: hypothetical protein GX622_02495 [Bacteroidales bacterium]|nr:hypothetical protein [Bacteroidales bacterium]